MNNDFNNQQFNNDNNNMYNNGFNNQPQQPVQPVYNDQMYQPQQPSYNQPQPSMNNFNQPVQNNFDTFSQPQQPSYNQPQYEQPQNNFNYNNGFVPNNQPQPSFGGQPSSPYTNNTKKSSKGGMIGIAGVAVVVAILLLYFIPLLTAKSPKGTWTCNYDMFTSMTFTSKSFTFSGNYSGYNTTLSGDYKISSTNVKAKKKKDGFKYYLYRVSKVKATAGGVSSNVDSGKGFIIGFSKDGKTIHYLSSKDDTAKSFECTKKD